jgi:hypothetical protein
VAGDVRTWPFLLSRTLTEVPAPRTREIPRVQASVIAMARTLE